MFSAERVLEVDGATDVERGARLIPHEFPGRRDAQQAEAEPREDGILLSLLVHGPDRGEEVTVRGVQIRQGLLQHDRPAHAALGTTTARTATATTIRRTDKIYRPEADVDATDRRRAQPQ